MSWTKPPQGGRYNWKSVACMIIHLIIILQW
jgi:hypothetical protein